MKIPKYARYNYVNQKVFEFIKEQNIKEYPIDMIEIIKKNKWALTPYSELQERFNCDINTVITCLRSKDGYTQYDDNNYSIAYNDVTVTNKRTAFTLAHEVAHIALNHLIDFEKTIIYRSNMTHEENIVLENEANAFARNLLAPSALVDSMKKKDKKEIMNIFRISYEATGARMSLLQKDINTDKSLNLYDKIISHFHNFMYKKHCLICDYYFTDYTAIYCPICGSNEFEWEVSNMIYNDGYELSNKHKAIVCPKCNNENFIEEGEYCHICGTHIVNKCSNDKNYDWNYNEKYFFQEECHEFALGNARYCIKCGSKTTFFEDGLLCDYTEYTSDSLLTQKSNNFFGDISDTLEPIYDEDIPF